MSMKLNDSLINFYWETESMCLKLWEFGGKSVGSNFLGRSIFHGVWDGDYMSECNH